MKTAVAILGPLEGVHENLVLSELAILDCFVNANNVLVNNTSSTNVQMADLGVAHESLRQTDGGGGGLKLGVSVLDLCEAVHHRAVGVSDGIAILGRLVGWNAPSVDDDCWVVSRPKLKPGLTIR